METNHKDKIKKRENFDIISHNSRVENRKKVLIQILQKESRFK